MSIVIDGDGLLPSLDGRLFVMISSTASDVDATSPTRFLYHEKAGLIWGNYDGDTVSIGRFVGTRVDNTLSVQFVHVVAATGAVVAGASASAVEWGADGVIQLVEAFMIGADEHLSVCVAVAAGG